MPKSNLPEGVTIVDHPLVRHKLTLLRRRETGNAMFRRTAQELALLLAYEVTRGLETVNAEIETPIVSTVAPVLAGRRPCVVSIMRAGNGVLDAMMHLLPEARTGFIGLRRDEETLEPEEYYFKVPDHLAERQVFLVDPMLATGRTAATAVARLRQAGAVNIRFLCIIASVEGLRRFRAAHANVPVFAAGVDEGLTDEGFITPGLGDAGDRLYGTD